MKNWIPIALLALALCAPAKAQSDPHTVTNFVVFLSGTNEVSPNLSISFGLGWFELDGNMLNFAFGGFLPDPTYPNSAGIYGPAHPGKEGHLIFGNLGWTISPPYIVYGGGLELTPSQIAQLRAGLLYVNIKSAQFPDGEVRGQIVPETPAPERDAETESMRAIQARIAQKLILLDNF